MNLEIPVPSIQGNQKGLQISQDIFSIALSDPGEFQLFFILRSGKSAHCYQAKFMRNVLMGFDRNFDLKCLS